MTFPQEQLLLSEGYRQMYHIYRFDFHIYRFDYICKASTCNLAAKISLTEMSHKREVKEVREISAVVIGLSGITVSLKK